MSKPGLVKFCASNFAKGTFAVLERYVALARCSCRQSATVLLCFVAAALAYAQDPIPGSLDLSFSGGTVKVANITPGPGVGPARYVGLQPDGGILMTGACFNGNNSDFCVVRLNPDGSLDGNFVGPNGVGNGQFLVPIGTSHDYATGLALQPDGKIVLAGQCNNGGITDFCVARLSADGSLDTTFAGPNGGGNGRFVLPVGTRSGGGINALALQPDGKILLAGACDSGTYTDFCVARLNTNGTLDPEFRGPGGGAFLLRVGTGNSYVTTLALQADGKIVLAGQCEDNGPFEFCLARLNPDGSIDASFAGPGGSGNGAFVLPLGTSHNFVKGVAVQPDGKILLVGHCWNGSDSDFCVARLHADGSFDANFGGPTGGGNGKFLLPIGTSHDYPLSLSLQPDGKIVLAGECRNGNKTDFCVARLLHDGSLDTTFDGPTAAGNGSFLLSVGLYSDYVAASVLQPDGKIVLAGSCGNGTNNDFCVARLHGGPFGARQCSLDVDGDGKVSASSDMLIGTRVALGMTGNNVLNGITFAPHATRTTWPDIRTYLVSQCGMVIRP